MQSLSRQVERANARAEAKRVRPKGPSGKYPAALMPNGMLATRAVRNHEFYLQRISMRRALRQTKLGKGAFMKKANGDPVPTHYLHETKGWMAFPMADRKMMAQ